MRLLLALGGNALLRRDETPDVATQARNAASAARAIASVAETREIVVTHGNGPQIGLLALKEGTDGEGRPLDILGAETEGMIGYLLARALTDALPGRPVLSLLTQVEVAPDDPAFETPSKPIGPFYDEAAWSRLADTHGWQGVRIGDRMRRVVASPHPRAIVEIEAIRRVVDAGILPVCAGGGGIPVARNPDGGLRGVDAVVDKDRTAALLAVLLEADALLLLTDVPGVFEQAPADAPGGAPFSRLDRRTAAGLDLPAGSMGPKVEAALWFAERTGRPAIVAALDRLADAVEGRSGTLVTD